MNFDCAVQCSNDNFEWNMSNILVEVLIFHIYRLRISPRKINKITFGNSLKLEKLF